MKLQAGRFNNLHYRPQRLDEGLRDPYDMEMTMPF
jgi:hypothetical protein